MKDGPVGCVALTEPTLCTFKNVDRELLFRMVDDLDERENKVQK